MSGDGRRSLAKCFSEPSSLRSAPLCSAVRLPRGRRPRGGGARRGWGSGRGGGAPHSPAPAGSERGSAALPRGVPAGKGKRPGGSCSQPEEEERNSAAIREAEEPPSPKPQSPPPPRPPPPSPPPQPPKTSAARKNQQTNTALTAGREGAGSVRRGGGGDDGDDDDGERPPPPPGQVAPSRAGAPTCTLRAPAWPRAAVRCRPGPAPTSRPLPSLPPLVGSPVLEAHPDPLLLSPLRPVGAFPHPPTPDHRPLPLVPPRLSPFCPSPTRTRGAEKQPTLSRPALLPREDVQPPNLHPGGHSTLPVLRLWMRGVVPPHCPARPQRLNYATSAGLNPSAPFTWSALSSLCTGAVGRCSRGYTKSLKAES